MTNIRTILLQLAKIKIKIKSIKQFDDLNLNQIQIVLDSLESLIEDNNVKDNIGNNEEVDRFVEEPIEEIKLTNT